MSADSSAALRAALVERRDRCGQDVGFWWRDDDLICDGAALRRLAAIGSHTGIEPLLAIIPGHADAKLGAALACLDSRAWFAQHGFVHANHDAPEAPFSEFCSSRVGAPGLKDIAEGRAILLAMGLPRFLDVFVPPWNRLHPAFLPLLPRLGFSGVSGYLGHCGFTVEEAGHAGLSARHAGVDATRRGAQPRIATPALLLARVTELIRTGIGRGAPQSLDAPLRVGILTHHRVMHDSEFDALEEVFGIMSALPGSCWLEPPDVFA